MKIATAFIVAALAAFAANPVLAQGIPQALMVENGPELQRIGNTLTQLKQQMQAYGTAQQKNPQIAIVVQTLLTQADYMHTMASVLYTQSQANAKAEASAKQAKQATKEAAQKLTPLAVQQKKISAQAMKAQQAKLNDAVTKIEQTERSKQAKDQNPIVIFQTALLRAHGQLDRIMLDEMED